MEIHKKAPEEKPEIQNDLKDLKDFGEISAEDLLSSQETEEALIQAPEREYSSEEIKNAKNYIREIPSDFTPEMINEEMWNNFETYTNSYLSNLLFLTNKFLEETNSEEKLVQKSKELFSASLKEDFNKERAKKFYKILESLI